MHGAGKSPVCVLHALLHGVRISVPLFFDLSERMCGDEACGAEREKP